MSEAVPCRSGGGDENRDELVRLVCERRIGLRAKPRAEPKPINRFTHFFCGHGYLVDEVGATLSAPRFLVIRTCRRDRTNELLSNVTPSHVARHCARERIAPHRKTHESLGNIVTNHTTPSTKRAAKLRIPIPIPIPCSTFSS
jgi:hypothetical protein